MGVVLAVAVAVGLALGHGVGVGLALGAAVPLADGLGVAVGLGLGVGDGLADPEAVGDGLADPETVGVGVGRQPGGGVLWSSTPVLPAVLEAWCVSSKAAGTMIMPSATVKTKASAPHSRRQKAHEDFRIRGLRPFPGWAYSGC